MKTTCIILCFAGMFMPISRVHGQVSLSSALADAIDYLQPSGCIVDPGNSSLKRIHQVNFNFSIRTITSTNTTEISTKTCRGTMAPSTVVKMNYVKLTNDISTGAGNPYSIAYFETSSAGLPVRRFCTFPEQTYTVETVKSSLTSTTKVLKLKYLTNNTQSNTITLSNSNSTVTRLTSGFTLVPSSGVGTIEKEYSITATTPDGVSVLFTIYLNYITKTLALPVISATATPALITLAITNPPSTTSTQLSGSATSANGAITSTKWEQVSGPSTSTITTATGTGSSLSTSATGLGLGTYTFRFTAKDACQRSASKDVTVIVSCPPPVANAGADQTFQDVTTYTLDGSASTSLNGGITSYKWEKLSGTAVTIPPQPTASPTTVITNMDNGTFTFRLTVTDACNTRSDEVKITRLGTIRD